MKTINRIEIVTTHRRVVIRCGEQFENPGNSPEEGTPAHVTKRVVGESDPTERLNVLQEAVRVLTDCIGRE